MLTDLMFIILTVAIILACIVLALMAILVFHKILDALGNWYARYCSLYDEDEL